MKRLTSHLLSAVTVFCCPALFSLQSAPSVDAEFVPELPAGAVVTQVLADGAGRLLVAGSWVDAAGAARETVVRLLPDGSLDAGFDAGTGANGAVTAVVVAPGGGVYVGGRFSKFDGVAACGLVRLRPDGSVDDAFTVGTGTSGGVKAVATDGAQVIAGGSFTQFGGVEASYLACRDEQGGAVPGFSAQLEATMVLEAGVDCVGVQADGKLLVGGNFQVAGAPANLVRLNPDGAVDGSFNGNAGPMLYPKKIVCAADGTILVAGLASAENVGFVRRLLPNGDVDAAFQAPAVQGFVHDLVVLPDGKLLVAGKLSEQPESVVFRLLPDGRLDGDWWMAADGPVLSLAVAGDGQVAAGGAFEMIGEVARPGLVLLTDGRPAFHGTSTTGSGAFRVYLAAVEGETYAIEYSADLRTWRNFSTNTATSAGLEVIDPDRGSVTSRFFRARLASGLN